MNVLSLFSGIGGLDLGLQRAGMTIAGQVEIDPWCRKVLAKHWPEVPRHDDVRTAAGWWLGHVADPAGARCSSGQPGESRQVRDEARRQESERRGSSSGVAASDRASRGRPAVDLVCGGFPCQPVSLAGKGLAQADSRWLWPAFAHVIRHLRPRYVLVENVPGLLGRGMGDVLGDLAALGYDAEWDSVPAAFVGAPHIRNRVWIVAYPQDGDGGDARIRPALQDPDFWRTEPGVGRVAHGIPNRVDRLRGLGNAVVPQVAEHIGHLIMKAAAA